MLEHFFQFSKGLDRNNGLLLHLDMDGPDISKSFEKKLNKNLCILPHVFFTKLIMVFAKVVPV